MGQKPANPHKYGIFAVPKRQSVRDKVGQNAKKWDK